MKKLAIFGGKPAFDTPRHVGRPNLADKDKIMQALGSVISSRWLTNNGPRVQKFEEQICHELAVDQCVAVANGTLGLEIAARALMPTLGEVIMPSFTFVATAHALAWQGYTPIFADIDPYTHVLDLKSIESKITMRTVGILGVHLWGTPCIPDELYKLARLHNLKLIFDAAHAFMCGPEGDFIGHYGDCEVFSFHATKFVNAVEGGAITTSNTFLARRLRRMRNFGFAGDGTHGVEALGLNAKMSELHAAVGLANIEASQSFIEWNYNNYAGYMVGLDHSDIRLYPLCAQGNFQYIVIELLGELSADVLASVLKAENVLARRYFSPPCHLMAPYKKDGQTLPATELVASRTLVLPTGLAMTQGEVAKVCEIVRYCVDHVEEVSKGVQHG